MRDQYSGWQKASHHTVATCNDCHVPHALIPKYLTKMENGYAHSRAFTMQDFDEPIQMRPVSRAIVQENCNECHRQLVSDIAQHEAPAGQQLDCLHCHSGVGHGPR
jgi:cytochrome c nitrite reductase small subunit